MKVVFDTNVLVSALVFPGARADAALRRIAQEQDVLLISAPILDELLGVLARKFARDGEELARIAIFLSDLAVTVRPRTRLCYVLPRVIHEFAARYPRVKVVLHQGNPVQVAEQTARSEVDVGIATETLASFPELVTLPCYQWNRCVLVPRGHPLSKVQPLTLAALARHPIITYDFAFTGRSQINAAFDAEGLEPNVVLTALDADVIKTYVDLGMGVGIVAQMAYDPVRDATLERLDASHLFAPSTTRLALRRDVFLRGYVYDFIGLFAPALDRRTVDAALAGKPLPVEK